uniref:Uncharacterized protein n=1 Tax=uncultured marine virus TaxID=186617 RepID=A0A0F7L4S6_9VIRU|nr:hypothetical protein [uncultured marine virus]
MSEITGSTGAAKTAIDGIATNGLSGVNNSLAYRVHEVEKHFHSPEFTIGEPETRNAEIDCFSEASVKPFKIDAGDGTAGAGSQQWTEAYGTPLCVIGTGYTSFYGSNVKFDAGTIQIHTVQSTIDKVIQRVQIIWGTGTVGDAITAKQFTSKTLDADDGGGKNAPIDFKMPRGVIGTTKVWVRLWVDNVNTGTMDFFITLHEYIG